MGCKFVASCASPLNMWLSVVFTCLVKSMVKVASELGVIRGTHGNISHIRYIPIVGVLIEDEDER